MKTKKEKGKENEHNFVRLLNNHDYWKPNFTKIFKELGINDNKTGFRIFYRLKEKGLIKESGIPAKIDVSGTKTDGAIIDINI